MGQIRRIDLEQELRGDIRDYGTTLPQGGIALSGGRARLATPSGLSVNVQDTRVETAFETRLMRPAGVVLHLVVEGHVRAEIDGAPMDFGRNDGDPARIAFSALGTARAFHRRFTPGQRMRKVSVVLGWDWLAVRGVSMDAVLGGTVHRWESWVAPAPDLARAEALIATEWAAGDTPARAFEKEALALSMLTFAVERLLTTGDALAPRERDQLARMESFASAAGPLPPLTDIAAAGGVSVSTMRRLFRRAHDCPVRVRLRALRFDRAAQALRQGCTVAEAAHLAGYESAPAFATAFRQATGVCPSRVGR